LTEQGANFRSSIAYIRAPAWKRHQKYSSDRATPDVQSSNCVVTQAVTDAWRRSGAAIRFKVQARQNKEAAAISPPGRCHPSMPWL
jgi:hypothetical protein